MDVTEVSKLDAYLEEAVRQRAHPRGAEEGRSAEVYIGEEDLGELIVDDEDGDRSYNFRMVIQVGETRASSRCRRCPHTCARKFDNENIRVVARPKKNDSLEAYIGEEFIGVLFVENEKGRRSYIFELPILDVDIDGAQA